MRRTPKINATEAHRKCVRGAHLDHLLDIDIALRVLDRIRIVMRVAADVKLRLAHSCDAQEGLDLENKAGDAHRTRCTISEAQKGRGWGGVSSIQKQREPEAKHMIHTMSMVPATFALDLPTITVWKRYAGECGQEHLHTLPLEHMGCATRKE